MHVIRNAFHSTDIFEEFADQINNYNPSLVIDCGCGNNQWKGKINNLIGFDNNSQFRENYINNPDYICSYLEFDKFVQNNSADFCFCLGSMHSAEDMSKELDLVYKWLKPGGKIIMRVRADEDDDSVYAWNLNKIHDITNKYNYKIIKPIEHTKMLLNQLNEQDFKWISTNKAINKKHHRRSSVETETSNRSTGQNKDNIFKSWFIWWWEKQYD
jgi:SAM-dependent methyltransferase